MAKRQHAWTHMGDLMEELIEEILIRLPVKSLLRLKATSKQWRSLINSPSFAKSYHRRHRHDHHNLLMLSRYSVPEYQTMYSLILTNDDDDDDDDKVVMSPPLFDLGWGSPWQFKVWSHDFALPDPGDDHPLDASRQITPYSCILGPLDNGIYCEIDFDQQRPNRISVPSSRISLRNHATREVRIANPFSDESAALLSHLARRPCRVHYGYGLVRNQYDAIIDYKVVLIVLSGQDYGRFVSFVYSLKRGVWDKIADVGRDAKPSKAVVDLVNDKGEFESPLLINYDLLWCPQLFLNASWHWLDVKYDRVLRFDVAKETFDYIGGPPHDYFNGSVDDEFIKRGLLLLDNRLAAIYLHHGCVGFDIWVMMEYGVSESWSKIYSCKVAFGFSVDKVLGLCYSTEDGTSHCTSAGNVIHIQRVLFDDSKNGQLVSWGGSQIVRHGFNLQPEDGGWNTLGVSTYVETLDSLSLLDN